jgi:hypothetical protein
MARGAIGRRQFLLVWEILKAGQVGMAIDTLKALVNGSDQRIIRDHQRPAPPSEVFEHSRVRVAHGAVGIVGTHRRPVARQQRKDYQPRENRRDYPDRARYIQL